MDKDADKKKPVKRGPGRPPSKTAKKDLPKKGIVDAPAHSGNKIEFMYDHPQIFRTIFKLFKKDSFNETRITFEPKYILIESIDNSGSVNRDNYTHCIRIKIACDNKVINHYYCKERFTVNIHPLDVQTMLKKIDKDYSCIYIFLNENRKNTSIDFVFTHPDIKAEEWHKISLIDPQSNILMVDNESSEADKLAAKLSGTPSFDFSIDNYPLSFKLLGKVFKKISTDINSMVDKSQLTIEYRKGLPLKLVYNRMPDNSNCPRSMENLYIFDKPEEKLGLKFSGSDNEFIGVTLRSDILKFISEYIGSKDVGIHCSNERDMIIHGTHDQGIIDIKAMIRSIRVSE